MEREACVCDHGFERSDLCAEIIIIINGQEEAAADAQFSKYRKLVTNCRI